MAAHLARQCRCHTPSSLLSAGHISGKALGFLRAHVLRDGALSHRAPSIPCSTCEAVMLRIGLFEPTTSRTLSRWQSVGLVYSLRRAYERAGLPPGPITRLISCTDAQWVAEPHKQFVPTFRVRTTAALLNSRTSPMHMSESQQTPVVCGSQCASIWESNERESRRTPWPHPANAVIRHRPCRCTMATRTAATTNPKQSASG